MIHKNAFCFCGSGKKWKNCHYPTVGEESFEALKKRYKDRWNILIKNPQEIAGIKKACLVTTEVLQTLCSQAKVGMRTRELDEMAKELCKERGAIAAPFQYGEPPFPGHVCISINDVVCHGIPNETILKEGDILNIDASCIVDGFFGDCSMMVALGEIDDQKRKVLELSYECLMDSISILKPGILVSDIGLAIEKIMQGTGCSIVDQFVGHGVGIHFHENPQIPHCKNRIDIPLASGMTFTIEPMINAGTKVSIVDPEDNWTARTKDGLPSAQWEHTILITPQGHEILTPWKRIC